MNQIASSVPTNHAPSRLKPIEELLIQKGHLKPEDLITAKLYQENQKNSGIHLTLGESLSAMDIQVRQTAYQVEFLLIYHEIVTTEQLNAAFRMRKTLQEKGVDKPIGQICVDELKIITQDELEKVLSQHREITPGKHRAKIVTVDTFLDSENPKIDTPVHQEKLKLGDALVAWQFITKEDLVKALEYQAQELKLGRHIIIGEALLMLNLIERRKFLRFTADHGYSMKTGELLLAHGLVNTQQLNEAIEIQSAFSQKGIDRKIWDILVQDMGIVNQERLIRIIAKQKNMVRVVPNISETDMNLLFLFPKETLRTNGFVPYKIYQKDDNGGLVISVLYHENIGKEADRIRQEIQKMRGQIMKMRKNHHKFSGSSTQKQESEAIETYFSYATPKEITDFLEESFRNERVLRAAAERHIIERKNQEWEITDRNGTFVIGKDAYSEGNENLNIFADILMQAIDLGTSDLHIEPLKDRIRVRIRIDGMLQTITELPNSMKEYFIRGLKSVFSFKNSYKSNIVVDDRKTIYYADRGIHADLRFSVVPTMHGEKLVARILTQKENIPSLEELGFQSNIAKKYELICSMASGIVIVTGPTGSGKTTTLHATLGNLSSDEKNIVTIENPPEYILNGAVQINAWGSYELEFHEVLKGVLRQDPDILMFGEMRDYESAQSALTAGLTGRLLFSTLHTNDAVSAITRLIDMGIRPFLLGSTLVSILAQRLVRRTCPDCKVSTEPNENELKYFKRYIDGVDEYIQKNDVKFCRGKGCHSCRYTGFKGRLTIIELFCVNEEIKIAVLEGKTASQLETLARKYGMTSMIEDGFYRVLAGDTTMSEVLRVVKTLQFPKVKRTVEEIGHLLCGNMTTEELENSVYGADIPDAQK